jgi:hypothetical protein
MRRGRPFYLLLTGLFVLLILATGCGKKGDPIPPQMKLPATIADLSVVSVKEGILLAWSLPEPLRPIGSFKLLRSETLEGNEACPECPQEYRPFKTVVVNDNRLRREGEGKFSYVDGDVIAGRYYSYRLATCDPNGFCGSESNAAGLIHEAIKNSVTDVLK